MKHPGILICLILLFFSDANAEGMPQWTKDCEFLYGMNVTDMNGELLPGAPLDVAYLREGIQVEIINGMPYSDRCMLLFLLNGHLQPFYVDDEKYLYISFLIDGNEHISWNIRFDELFLTDNQIHYLQCVSIGLLDVRPIDINDPIDHYINAVTIPFFTDELANTYIPMALAQYRLPDGIVRERCGNSCQLDFYQKVSNQQITYPPFVQNITSDACSFNLIATGKYNVMQMIMICDEIPYVSDDLSLICFSLEYGYGYTYNFAPNGIKTGSHQAFGIAFPIYNTALFSTSTPKISFTITQ